MMSGFVTALRAEIFIALRNYGNRIAVLAPLFIVSAQLILTRLGQAGETARDALLNDSPFGSNTPVVTAYGYFVDGLGTGLTLLVLIMVALAAHSFAYDRDTGLLRHLLIRRVSRPAVITAKLLQLHLTALIALALLLVGTWAVSAWLWDFGPVVEDGFELIGEGEIRAEILLGLRLALLPLPAVIAFGMLVSVLTYSTTQAVTTALGINLAIDIFKATLGDSAYYLYATFQPALLDQSYLGEVSSLVRGFSDVLIDQRMLTLNTWIPIPQMLLLVLLSLWLVQRRKI
ncbi:MAG: ABC transporter permease subunit [Gammaproteobacteria bacterium]|jgi:ABC-type transport system involved in multi-copper enzyme maturation permease subunit